MLKHWREMTNQPVLLLIETLHHTLEMFKDIKDTLTHAFQYLKCLKTGKNEILDMLTD